MPDVCLSEMRPLALSQHECREVYCVKRLVIILNRQPLSAHETQDYCEPFQESQRSQLAFVANISGQRDP